MKKITTDDLLNDRTLFTEKEAQEIKENAMKKAIKIWGGKREGAGRKKKGEQALNISAKVSVIELDFLHYARANNLDLKKLMS